MSQCALKVEHVSKEYQIRHSLESPQSSFKAVLNAPFNWLTRRTSIDNRSRKAEAFYALKDVSFDVQYGESVGLIGRNGAGKSTLLKILSRITRPSKGRVTLYYHVNSLLEVGTGFNTELSGRDNIYLSGSFLGMKIPEIQRKFDEIVAFSEIEQFIDTPVKYYSSGMFVRLAFSVAVHLTPEILLLDEVLAVGDADFRQKSFNKMKELLSSGATIIFVSHNEAAVKEICKRAIWLSHGEIKLDGGSVETVNKYIEFINLQKDTSIPRIPQFTSQVTWDDFENAPGNTITNINNVAIRNQNGDITHDLKSGEDIAIQFRYWNKIEGKKLTTTLVLFNDDGTIVLSSLSNHESNWHNIPRQVGLYQSTCIIPANLLSPGTYCVSLIICADNYTDCFREDNTIRFKVADSGEVRGDYQGVYSGIVRPLLKWNTSLILSNIKPSRGL